jgi:hypothetical protein
LITESAEAGRKCPILLLRAMTDTCYGAYHMRRSLPCSLKPHCQCRIPKAYRWLDIPGKPRRKTSAEKASEAFWDSLCAKKNNT